jgi:hypothetical protein
LSLTYNSRIIADARIVNISGRQGIGSYQLRFSVELSGPAWSDVHEVGAATLTDLCADIFAGTDRVNLKFLGHAEPEIAITIEPTQNSYKNTLLFDLNLNGQQLFALEEIRNGHDLFCRFVLKGKTQGKLGASNTQEEIQYDINVSVWARVLRDLGYADIFIVGVELPIDDVGGKLQPAITLIRHAHADLLGGRYDDVIVKCRKALDSVHATLEEKDKVIAAVDHFVKGSRKGMTKIEREFLIGEATRHYTHLAHHVDGNGAPEWYSRSDALFLLTLAAGLISSAIGRLKASTLQCE